MSKQREDYKGLADTLSALLHLPVPVYLVKGYKLNEDDQALRDWIDSEKKVNISTDKIITKVLDKERNDQQNESYF